MLLGVLCACTGSPKLTCYLCCAVLHCVYACRSQISTYDASRLKVQQLPHLQESPASQQVGAWQQGVALD
jgi:hypothetical protein